MGCHDETTCRQSPADAAKSAVGLRRQSGVDARRRSDAVRRPRRPAIRRRGAMDDAIRPLGGTGHRQAAATACAAGQPLSHCSRCRQRRTAAVRHANLLRPIGQPVGRAIWTRPGRWLAAGQSVLLVRFGAINARRTVGGTTRRGLFALSDRHAVAGRRWRVRPVQAALSKPLPATVAASVGRILHARLAGRARARPSRLHRPARLSAARSGLRLGHVPDDGAATMVERGEGRGERGKGRERVLLPVPLPSPLSPLPSFPHRRLRPESAGRDDGAVRTS